MTPGVRFGPLETLYDHALACMETTVHGLAGIVPSPQPVETKQGPGFRYKEQGAKQAIIQKLARLVSTLRATRLLLDSGFVQEVGTLKRVLDEMLEDVHFLAHGLKAPTDLHSEFLENFYEEEFNADTARASTQKRRMVDRRKIRASFARAVSDIPGSQFNPSDLTADTRSVDKANSGYVHGASPQLMELYGGQPPRFHMNGMSGTPLEQDHRKEFRNYVYRSICAFGLVVGTFGVPGGLAKIRAFADRFERFGRGDSSLGSRGKPLPRRRNPSH